MLVYRICGEDEAIRVLNGDDFNHIGKPVKKFRGEYDFDNYLPFFIAVYNMFYLKDLVGKFICAYDIPEEILAVSKDTECYQNFAHPHAVDNINQYLVNCDLLSHDYLVSMERIVEPITFVDYFHDSSTVNFTETIYERDREYVIIK